MKKAAPKKLSARALELIAEQFRVLAEPTRLRLLNELRLGEKTVSELIEVTGALQANISRHLGVLSKAAMVGRRKAGANAYYFISDPKIVELCELMCARLEKDLSERSSHFR